jgi:hypothetical protein
MYAATRHASLQNADAVLTQLHGVITGLYLPFPRPFPVRLDIVRLGLGLDDVYWSDEPVAVRVRGASGTDLMVTVTGAATGARVAQTPVRLRDDPWTPVECAPLPSGTYRITVAGDERVEPAGDVFAVFDRT